MEQIRFFRKRSGRIVNFRIQKIADAIAKALTEACTALASQVDAKEASMKLAEEVKGLLDDEHSTYFVQPDSVGSRIPRLEHVQDTVVHVISEPHVGITGYDATFAEMTGRLYSEYRRRREEARKLLKVRSEKDNADVTDKSLLLSDTAQSLEGWERERIIKDLEALHIDADKAEEIAKDVEMVLLKSGLHSVSSELITELVNNELVNRGMRERLNDGKVFEVPEDFINGLLKEKTTENSNVVANSPEAVSFDIVNLVWKQYALKNIFSPDVVKAHSTGALHIHDLNFPTRGYCGSHSLEYLKKYGLKGLVNLNTTSKPAKTASVLTGHLNTFLASMQAYYAGALGLGYVNILYAPLLVGNTDKELKQIAQELIFNCSQNAFSRGGQCLFIDTNVHSGIPGYLENVPAIGPGGHYYADADGINTPLEERTIEGDWCLVLPAKEEGQDDRILLREHDGKQTFYDDGVTHVMRYGDYKEEAARFAEALLEVWKEGDANGHVFEFPKCDFHVSAETFTDARQYRVFQKACELASHNGSTYFVFDRDSVSLASCCFAPMTPVLIKDGTEIHRMSIVGAYAHYSKTNKTIRVYDRGAWRKAKVIRLKGKGRRMLTIKFACNKEVTCTADHEFPTKDGVKKAYELTNNDLIEMSTEVLKNRGDSGFARLCGALATLAVFTKHPKGQGKLVFDVCNDIDGVKIGMDEFLLGALRDAGIKDGFAILPSDKGTYIEITNPEIINGVEELYMNVEGACCFNGRIYNTHEEARFAVLLAMLSATVTPVEMETEQAEYLTNQLEAIATTVGVTLYNDPSEEGRLNFSPTFVGVKDKILNYGEKSYIKIESIEEAPEENWVYCFSMMDTKKPFFTLPSGIVTHNCRLKVQITDMSLLQHPERLRTLGFQNVTINIPQCAYRAKHRMEAEGVDDFNRLNKLFIEEIDHMMDLCKAAHAQKRKFIESIMVPGAPMWQMAMPSNDGKPYLNLDTAVYIIGMIGLNDAINYLTGEEMHESDAAMDYALKVMSHMFLRSKEYSKETGLTFKLEESPAESAARRLAKADLVYYRDDALKVFKGTEDAAYYTNSIHLAAAAPVTLVERIRKQSMFHSVIESGAIIHAFIGEESPTAGAIEELVTQTFLKTQCAQLVFSPEFTYCLECGGVQRGLVDSCNLCGSRNVVGETRVVGYNSRISSWGISKRDGELVDRHKGRYRVTEAE